MTDPINLPTGLSSKSTDSISSGFGSFEDKQTNNLQHQPVKRRQVDSVAELDRMMQSSLSIVTPGKRLRFDDASNVSPLTRSSKCGRPPTRRSNSTDSIESPNAIRMRLVRAATTGSSPLENLRSISAVSTDSVSPKTFHHLCSPRRRTTAGNNLYAKYRLGATFSPMTVGSKKRCRYEDSEKNSQMPNGNTTPEFDLTHAPRKSELRRAGAMRSRKPLNDRLHDRFNMLDES